MCGIAGSWRRDGLVDEVAARRNVTQMARSLAHRGPDGDGAWVDAEAGIAFGHRRLAILDLSPAGDQPMRSESGRYCIVYNGEIYNHVELRRRLSDEKRVPAWRGHSDTETLLACIEAWGIEATLDRITGMFAFALWDAQERALILARDRMGEKPLCYAMHGNTLLFASELRAFGRYPGFEPAIDRGALVLLLQFNCIPAPHSIRHGVRKLPPGTWLRIPAGSTDLPEPVPYWSLGRWAEAGERAPFDGGATEAAASLRALLGDVVRSQMLSDVPLGAFLSGGIDSSTIVALLQEQSDRPVRTFTIGFHEADFDEARHAAAVAKHLGTNHETVYLTARDALDVVTQLGAIFDEPFADVSQIPTILLSRLTRAKVTVAMSGDGGDEIFGGYNRYLLPEQIRQKLVRLPAGASDIDDLYVGRVRKWPAARSVVRGAEPLTTLVERRSEWPVLAAPESRMMAVDALSYLPDNILVKVDRSAMSASLETRAPYLDRRVVEFAWRLPPFFKAARAIGKRVLRDVLYEYVPRALFDRPKQGFSVPVDDWLRGSLRDWAEPLLSERRLRDDGIFDPAPIRNLWDGHQSRRHQFGNRLWAVLMFQAWLDAQRNPN
jgi:asparagine synthase (glutamine-hydrolysing)